MDAKENNREGFVEKVRRMKKGISLGQKKENLKIVETLKTNKKKFFVTRTNNEKENMGLLRN